MAKRPQQFETPSDTYSALQVIGEGGAGRVYEVRNSSDEMWALKCLARERITTERLKRFKNEIEFCQRQSHPNIIQIIDTGFVTDHDIKCPFYVMKRYSGTLRTRMEGLASNKALSCFVQILDGVEAAHLLRVWHRDLKPENVLWDESEERLVVADFGIAHFEEEEIYTAVETKDANRMANFQYSAPEQRVRNQQVDHRSDIFALGLLLNELFTGKILQGTGYKRIGDVVEEFSYLDALVELMTQQNPDRRPASIGDIKKELIGRKNDFVVIQDYDALKKQVVVASEPEAFEPARIIEADYVKGVLHLTLSRPVPAEWGHEFRSPRGGYSSVVGYGPERFAVHDNDISIGVPNDEKLIQRIVDYAKNYASVANQIYGSLLKSRAIEEERNRRAELEKRVADAETRKNIRKNIML